MGDKMEENKTKKNKTALIAFSAETASNIIEEIVAATKAVNARDKDVKAAKLEKIQEVPL
jgi:hypothetical protein